ncbi:MAG: glycosyltransferase [Lachnospiraceae bacterium]|jgi:glycosyltransferase involved in cell wall biosynthesis|nr:glycosyltransferase [Lachnospiraceae bacterium]
MKNDFPLVSVALLTYNHEQYIEDNILGLLEQDYPNMELIILDDASKDKTVKIIEFWMEKLEEKFCKVVFFKNKKNSGNISHNVNCMLKEAEGAYCKSISGDDILADNYISKLVQCLIDNPQCSVAYSNQYVVGDDFKRGDRTHWSNQFYTHRKSGIEGKDLFRKLMFGNCIAAPSAMIKREVFDRIGFYDELMLYEDYEFWIRVAYHGGKFYYLDENLVYYRRGSTSLTNYSSTKRKTKVKTSMLAVGKTLKKYFRYLSKEDQMKCKKLYYSSHLKLCWDAKFWRGIFSILFQMKRNNISFK